MNFLAHSLLGFDDPALITGQFCGDFVRGSDLSHLPEMVEQGIRLHRHLDRFTDTHPVLATARSGIRDVPRRFAGIVVDVLFDHYLARHWGQFSQRSLEEHAHLVNQALHVHREFLPESLLRFMDLLSEEDILVNNRELEAIELTLNRLSRRSDRFGVLAIPIDQLMPLRERLHVPFSEFFPDLHETASAFLARSGNWSNDSE